MELDGFRGIAAIAVFFHHLSFASIARTPGLWNAPIATICKVSRYGLYGVDLFFVLSGYLITTILLNDRSSANFYFNFYWKRALRILPLYLVSLLAAWLWFQSSIGGVIVSVFFIANFAGLFHVSLAGPYWTLAIEEQFYLVWPRFVRRLRIDRLKTLALAVVIAEPVLRLIATVFHHYNFRFTFFRCDGLALGALLACHLYREERNPSTPSDRRRKTSAIWLLILSC
ncbi:MAG TPA: acyltransferase, partial [Acidobacteriaceae bacterium]|nr:acyltransferase [Acidobacteriaceae bacterium]